VQLLDDRDADAVQATHDDVAGQLIGVRLDRIVGCDRGTSGLPRR